MKERRKISSALPVILLLALLSTKGIARPDTTSKTVSDLWVKSETEKTINIAAQKGKVVFINFWALSCVPCKEEMPTINKLHERFKADTNILIVPIDLDNTLAQSTKYMREQGFGLTVYTAVGVVPKELFRGELPTTVVIDKHGKIVLFKEGKGDYGSKEFILNLDSLD